MDVPVGRGRGRFRNTENGTAVISMQLRRPHLTEEDVLTKKLDNLKLSVGDESAENENSMEVASYIRSAARSENDLNLFTEVIHECAAEERKLSKHIALIYQNLADLTVGRTKFRSLLLQKLQKDFEEKDLLMKNKQRFMNLVVLLCEVFHTVRVNGAVHSFLCDPVIAYLKILMQGSSDTEVEIVTEQVMKNGKDLEKHAVKDLRELLMKIREKLIYDQFASALSRRNLLHCLEYSLNGWDELPEDLQALYK